MEVTLKRLHFKTAEGWEYFRSQGSFFLTAQVVGNQPFNFFMNKSASFLFHRLDENQSRMAKA